MNMKYLSIFLCLLQFILIVSCSFLIFIFLINHGIFFYFNFLVIIWFFHCKQYIVKLLKLIIKPFVLKFVNILCLLTYILLTWIFSFYVYHFNFALIACFLLQLFYARLYITQWFIRHNLLSIVFFFTF